VRVFGRFVGASSGVGDGPPRRIPDLGNALRIGKGGAWALVRTDLRDLTFKQEADGSFVILDGEVFGGRAPTDVLLARFRKEGPVCLAELNGTAAVTIWDARSRTLVLARDRWGFGSCFWMESAGSITFGSDILPLIRSDPRSELDEAALDLFLAGGFISAPWTSVAHIKKIPSAHCLTVNQSGARLSRYWRATGRPKIRAPLHARKELLEHGLVGAVQRHLPGSAKSAILLSGGIDSMFLAALLVRRFGLAPTAFTYRYAQYDGKFNELDRACAAARLLGLDHHEMTIGPQDIVDNLDHMLIQHNGPLSYGAHSAILKDVAASGAEILYNGQGNGALYPSAAERLGLLLSRTMAQPSAPLRLAAMVGDRLRWPASARYAVQVARTGLNWRFHAPLSSDEVRKAIYADPGRLDRARRATAELFSEVVAEFSDESGDGRLAGPLHRLYSADGTLTWSAAFGRAHGLSPRSPYYDNVYVELLYRMRRSGAKRELRELAGKLLPRELAFAPKTAQTIPIAHWFRGPLSSFLIETLGADRLSDSGMFRHQGVRELHRRHLEGEGSHGWTLWNVLMITEWQRIVAREAGRYTAAREQDHAMSQILRLA
jgi:asparagine synthase (glutamine-hydrolysing)